MKKFNKIVFNERGGYPTIHATPTGYYREDPYCDRCKQVVPYTFQLGNRKVYCDLITCGSHITRVKITELNKKEYNDRIKYLHRFMGNVTKNL